MSSSSSIPPPSFADFKFTVIGQQPQLLQRIAAPGPNFRAPSPSPTSECNLQYPPFSSRSPSRPSLLNVLSAQVHPSDSAMADVANEVEMEVDDGKNPDPPLVHVASSPSIDPVPDESGSVERNGDSSPRILNEFKAYPHQRNLAPSLFSSASGESSQSPFAGLRAVQSRLQSRISSLDLQDPTNAVLSVQNAHSKVTNALSMAKRAYTLAQQALTSAAESLTAAQHCFTAAEEAKSFANDAATVMENLINGGEGISGSSRWECKSVISGLQEDLRALGEWVGQREADEDARRRLADSVEQQTQEEAFFVSTRGLPQTNRQHSCIVAPTRPDIADIQHLSRAVNSLQGQDKSIDMGSEDFPGAQSSAQVDCLVPAHSSQPSVVSPRERAEAAVQGTAQLLCGSRPRHDEGTSYSAQPQQDDGELMAQRKCDIEQRNLEVARFQILERERREDGEAGGTAQTDAKSPPGPPAQGHAAFEGEEGGEEVCIQVEQDQRKVLEVRHVEEAKKSEAIGQRKRQRVEGIRRKQEAEEALVSEADMVRERELLAEQERRRQEVTEQKQRANAETAARIRAKRAKKMGSNGLAATEAQLQNADDGPSPQYGNVVAGQDIVVEMLSRSAKPRSLSGGVKLRSLVDPQPPPSLPPSPTFSRAALGLRPRSSPPIPLPHKLQTAFPSERSDRVGGVDNISGNEVPSSSFETSSTVTLPVKASALPAIPPTSPSRTSATDTSPAEEGNICLHRRSWDPGNVPLIPRGMASHPSTQAQAANLRFVGAAREALLETYPRPFNLKPEPMASDPTPPNIRATPPVQMAKLVTEPASNGPQPLPQFNLPHLKSTNTDHMSKKMEPSANAHPPTEPVNAILLVPSPPSPPTNNCTNRPDLIPLPQPHTRTAVVSPQDCPLPGGSAPNFIGPPEVPRTTTNNCRYSVEVEPLLGASTQADEPCITVPRGRHTNAQTSKIRRLDHYSPIRQVGHYALSPRDERLSNRRPNSPTTMWYQRGEIIRAPSTLGQPVLGKRRNREELCLDPSVYRYWQTDINHDNHSHTARPAQRSPSPDRPALGSRIGGRDPRVHYVAGGQSYRPLYPPSPPLPAQPRRAADVYHSPSANYMNLGRHQVTDSRFGRTSENSLNRASKPAIPAHSSSKVRGYRNGGRPLMHRITSRVATTLMDRLESPPP